MDRKTELTREYIRRTHDGRIDQCKGREYGEHDICAVCHFKIYCEDNTAYYKKDAFDENARPQDRSITDADVEAVADKVIERVKELLAEVLASAQVFELGGTADDVDGQNKS